MLIFCLKQRLSTHICRFLFVLDNQSQPTNHLCVQMTTIIRPALPSIRAPGITIRAREITSKLLKTSVISEIKKPYMAKKKKRKWKYAL